ncbi:MAG: hypothetical protein J5585_01170 [Clostridia bacterium]|nr:hypothetical protein [Clostridia bacterium]
MKRLFAVIITAVMIMTVFVFNANAAANEWVPYGKIHTYSDHYESEEDMPQVAGMRYTDAGVQMYTPTKEQLETWGKTAYCSMQMKDKISFADGLKVVITVDEFTQAGVDKWISFNLWTDEMPTPEAAGYGNGWLCLIRPGSKEVTFMSFLDRASNLIHQEIYNVNIYEHEAITLEVKKVDGVYDVYLNDCSMHVPGFDDRFEDKTCYLAVACHQGNTDPIACTVNLVNDEMPRGNESYEPFVPNNIVPPEDPGEIPAGEPVFILDADHFKSNEFNAGAVATLNDDGTIHLDFTDVEDPILLRESRKYNYSADDFPVFAMLYKDLDEIGQSATLYFFAGDVLAPQEGSMCGLNWIEGDFDEKNDNGWRLIVKDLSEALTWQGVIHGYRLGIGEMEDLAGKSADIKWIGNFRSVEEAYAYAGLSEYYKETIAPPTPPTAPADDTTEPVTTVDTEPDNTSAEVTDDTGKTTDDKSNAGLIIGIIAGVAAAVIIAVVVIMIVKKKKK